MSGYGEDRRRGGGRDYRERSPHRSRYDDRPRDRDRAYDDRARGHDSSYMAPQRARGRDDRGSDARGYGPSGRGESANPPSVSSGEKLPDLPKEVTIPKDGRRLDLPVRPAEGTIGRSLTIAVNHFPVESLPVIKVSSEVSTTVC